MVASSQLEGWSLRGEWPLSAAGVPLLLFIWICLPPSLEEFKYKSFVEVCEETIMNCIDIGKSLQEICPSDGCNDNFMWDDRKEHFSLQSWLY